jgi:F-type H+-transporting ATPase subunit epsilon
MADAFEIEIATPERLLARDRAIRAQIPAKDGYIGVLPDHAPLLSELGIGAMTFTSPDNKIFTMSVVGGFLEINNNVVRVLTDVAERGHEIDVSRAERALKKAQEAMISPGAGIDIASALIAAQRAQARIDAAQREASKQE